MPRPRPRLAPATTATLSSSSFNRTPPTNKTRSPDRDEGQHLASSGSGALNPPSLRPESDSELLLALSHGTPQAVAELYQRHGPRMVAFARRYVDDHGAAEDIVVGLL